MNWLNRLLQRFAEFILRKARQNPNISAREFDEWKRDYKHDFGKDFK